MTSARNWFSFNCDVMRFYRLSALLLLVLLVPGAVALDALAGDSRTFCAAVPATDFSGGHVPWSYDVGADADLAAAPLSPRADARHWAAPSSDTTPRALVYELALSGFVAALALAALFLFSTRRWGAHGSVGRMRLLVTAGGTDVAGFALTLTWLVLERIEQSERDSVVDELQSSLRMTRDTLARIFHHPGSHRACRSFF
ncbi:MAG: hypothetical protein JNK74_22220 [Candidatus Hydrogenedentes bacterium]|nr:hypothetical protein [Candidatus Hydrogenedentota bacterium]